MSERFHVVLEARPDSTVPVAVRLKRLLKTALRAYGFRCRSAVAVPTQPADAKDVIPPDCDDTTLVSEIHQ